MGISDDAVAIAKDHRVVQVGFAAPNAGADGVALALQPSTRYVNAEAAFTVLPASAGDLCEINVVVHPLWWRPAGTDHVHSRQMNGRER